MNKSTKNAKSRFALLLAMAALLAMCLGVAGCSKGTAAKTPEEATGISSIEIEETYPNGYDPAFLPTYKLVIDWTNNSESSLDPCHFFSLGCYNANGSEITRYNDDGNGKKQTSLLSVQAGRTSTVIWGFYKTKPSTMEVTLDNGGATYTWSFDDQKWL